MALLIRDAEVEVLVEEIRRITKVKTKTEAVRRALRAYLVSQRRGLPLNERLARSKALADALGPGDPTFDMKRFTDKGWGEP